MPRLPVQCRDARLQAREERTGLLHLLQLFLEAGAGLGDALAQRLHVLRAERHSGGFERDVQEIDDGVRGLIADEPVALLQDEAGVIATDELRTCSMVRFSVRKKQLPS